MQDEKVKGKGGDEEAKLQGNGEKAADRGDNESNEKKAENNGEKESKGEENEEGVLKGSEIASMTAAQMKNELVARGVALPKKPVKAALLKLLKEVVKNNIHSFSLLFLVLSSSEFFLFFSFFSFLFSSLFFFH